MRDAAFLNVVGSSTLTRGKLIVDVSAHCLVGLIPAHAGKTALRRTKTKAARAHPRSRGENATVLSGPPGLPGSSPLTRGKPGQLTKVRPP